MLLAGPRKALWHALIRRNYGVTYLIVSRDHASPGKDSNGTLFYGPYDAQELVEQHSEELGVKMVRFQSMVYLSDKEKCVEVDEVPEGARTASISGTDVRDKYLDKGVQLPTWFTHEEIADILT